MVGRHPLSICKALKELPAALKAEVDGALCGHAVRPMLGLIQVDGDIKENPVEQNSKGLFQNDGSCSIVWNTPDGSPRGGDALKEAAAFHPLVRPHPVTGVPALYSPCGTNLGIVGKSAQESFDVFSRVLEHCMQPRYRYDHAYAEGDIVMYDTSATMHRANALPSATDVDTTRIMLRISNQGVHPDVLPHQYTEGVHYNVKVTAGAGAPAS